MLPSMVTQHAQLWAFSLAVKGLHREEENEKEGSGQCDWQQPSYGLFLVEAVRWCMGVVRQSMEVGSRCWGGAGAAAASARATGEQEAAGSASEGARVEDKGRSMS